MTHRGTRENKSSKAGLIITVILVLIAFAVVALFIIHKNTQQYGPGPSVGSSVMLAAHPPPFSPR